MHTIRSGDVEVADPDGVLAPPPLKRTVKKLGASWSYARHKWMQVHQLVDRRGNRYVKKVEDPETGEVLRDVDEPLTDHQGYGSSLSSWPFLR